MKRYYTSNIARDILDTVKQLIKSRFADSVVWHRDALLASIRSAPVYPSLQGLSDDSIMSIISADAQVHVIGDYVCF